MLPGDLRMLHAVWGQHWDRTGQHHVTWKNTFFINSLNIFPLFFKQLSSVGTILLFSQLEGQQCPSTGFGRGVVQKIAGKINDKDQAIVIFNSQKVWNTGLRPQKTLKLHSLLNKEPEFQYHLRLHNTSQIFFFPWEMFSRFPLFLVLASDTNTTRTVYLKSVLANNSGAGKDSSVHWLH